VTGFAENFVFPSKNFTHRPAHESTNNNKAILSPPTLPPPKTVPLAYLKKQAGLRSQRVELITCDITPSKHFLLCHASSDVCNVASVRCAAGPCAVVSAPLQNCDHAAAEGYGVTGKYFSGGVYKQGCVRKMIWLHTNLKGSNRVGQGGSVVGGERGVEGVLRWAKGEGRAKG